MGTDRQGRYKVVIGVAGTLLDDGRAVYHHLGDLIDLGDKEAERLLSLGAVVDTRVPPTKPSADK